LELSVPSSDGLPKNWNEAGRWPVGAGPWSAWLVLRPPGVGVMVVLVVARGGALAFGRAMSAYSFVGLMGTGL